ncbi:hypothetical protein WEH80_23380 [Actinomycetes bacterium KLBMP 9759]
MADGDVSQGAPEPLAHLRRRYLYPLVVLLLFLSNVPLAFIIWLWPGVAELQAAHDVHLLGLVMSVSPEQRILLIVAFCGLLGGSIRLLLRIRNEFSSDRVSALYIPWYFLTPPIGAILAVGFYFVVRGGFFSNTTSAQDVNLFAFAGTGVLVGLFAESAVERLEGAFFGAFTARPESSSNGAAPNGGDSRRERRPLLGDDDPAR